MAHSVKRHLDVDADAYDVAIRRFIPYYDDMLATGVELLAALAPPEAHVLDLGGGTGALSAAVLGGLPEARVTVLDVDGAMLAEGRRRLARFGERVAFREASFLDPLPAADAVMASLALHHVQTSTPRPASTARSMPRWPGGRVHQHRRGDDGRAAAQRAGIPALGGAHGRARDREAKAREPFRCVGGRGRYFTLDEELAALRRAGFAEVECFWRRGDSAICCALRA